MRGLEEKIICSFMCTAYCATMKGIENSSFWLIKKMVMKMIKRDVLNKTPKKIFNRL